MYSVFIDGQEGTTGLQIRDRLINRADIKLLEIPPEKRKDISAKREYLNAVDVVILCLPDVAAKESVALISNPQTRVIDASTAHRVAPDWVYGLPELTKTQRSMIRSASRVSNPGCYATGFVLLVRPLVESGTIAPEDPVTCSAVSGYSGAGKKMIAAYQTDPEISAARLGSRNYALGLNHKHIPEMERHSGLLNRPLFMPVVCDYYKGMTVTIPLHASLLRRSVTPADLHEIYSQYYDNEMFISMQPLDMAQSLEEGFLNPVRCNDTNRCDLFVFGNSTQMVVAACFDNLGKGASGAAVQNMNIMVGAAEAEGLV